MVGQQHRLNRQEFEQTLGNREGQGSPEPCLDSSPALSQAEQNVKTVLISFRRDGNSLVTETLRLGGVKFTYLRFSQLLSYRVVLVCVCSVVYNFLQSHGLQPARLPIHGISQARLLEWVAISSSRGSYQPRDRTHVSCGSCIGRQIFYLRQSCDFTIILICFKTYEPSSILQPREYPRQEDDTGCLRSFKE